MKDHTELLKRLDDYAETWPGCTPAAAAIRDLQAQVKDVTQDREYIVGWNAGFDHAMQETLKLQFPTMLRKMWSGGEVQQWLEKAKAEARTTLERS